MLSLAGRSMFILNLGKLEAVGHHILEEKKQETVLRLVHTHILRHLLTDIWEDSCMCLLVVLSL